MAPQPFCTRIGFPHHNSQLLNLRIEVRNVDYFFFADFDVLAACFLPPTAALRTAPALNTGRLLAGIVIFCLVRISRPGRAARARTSKLPKPVRVSLSPFF